MSQIKSESGEGNIYHRNIDNAITLACSTLASLILYRNYYGIDCEAVTQECAMSFYETFDPARGPARAFMWKIVEREVMAQFTDNSRRDAMLVEVARRLKIQMDESDPSPPEDIADTITELASSGKLTDEIDKAIALLLSRGLTHAAIAREIGQESDFVRQRIKRIKDRPPYNYDE